MMKVIKTEKQHEAALVRVSHLMATLPPTGHCAELEQLVTLVEQYENEHYPINDVTPGQFIAFRLSELSMTQTELANRIGVGKSRISEILNGKAELSAPLIRKLHAELSIPLEILIAENTSANYPRPAHHCFFRPRRQTVLA